MYIYLIRHAKQNSTCCNVNVPLSPLGKEQAGKLAKRLARFPADILYSSELIRAVETAEIINGEMERIKGRPLEHVIRKDLRECDFGTLTGTEDALLAETQKDFFESRYFAEDDWGYPGGENGQSVYRRTAPILQEIINLDAEHVLVVTHGGVIRSVLAQLFQKGQADRLMFGKYLQHAGITELYYDKEKMRFYLERFNDRAHLEKD